MMPTAKRVRTIPSADRVKVVEKALRFHEVLGLVQFHHAGHLKSYEADAKEVRDAAIARLCRAFAILEDINERHDDMVLNGRRADGNSTMSSRRLRREAQREGIRQVRAFAPELMAGTMDVDLDVDLDADFDAESDEEWEEDFDTLFDQVREDYAEYTQRRRCKAELSAHLHAWALLNACDKAGFGANLREAQIVALRQIREFAPELTDRIEIGSACSEVHAYNVMTVYEVCRESICNRMYFGPTSLYKDMRGESSLVRHPEAHRMAGYVQEEYIRESRRLRDMRYFNDIPEFSHQEERIAHLRLHAERVLEKIQLFAPELVSYEEGSNPWHIIRRVIKDTA